MTPPPDRLPRPGGAPAAPFTATTRRLLHLCLALGTPRPLADVLDVILGATTDLLDCERASLLLYDAAAGQLRFVAATSEETEALAQIPVPLHGSLAGTVFRENRAVVSADATADPRHFAEPGEALAYRPRAIASVPLRIDGAPVGVLQALDPHDGPFSEADLALLDAVAAQAAVAVHEARQRHALDRARAALAESDRLKSRLLVGAAAVMDGAVRTVRDAAERLAAHGDAAAEALARAADEAEALACAAHEVGQAHDEPASDAVVLQDVLRELAPGLARDVPDDPLHVAAHPGRLARALALLVRAADAADVPVAVLRDGRDVVVELGAVPPDPDALDVVVARLLLGPDGGRLAVASGRLRVLLPGAAA